MQHILFRKHSSSRQSTPPLGVTRSYVSSQGVIREYMLVLSKKVHFTVFEPLNCNMNALEYINEAIKICFPHSSQKLFMKNSSVSLNIILPILSKTCRHNSAFKSIISRPGEQKKMRFCRSIALTNLHIIYFRNIVKTFKKPILAVLSFSNALKRISLSVFLYRSVPVLKVSYIVDIFSALMIPI